MKVLRFNDPVLFQKVIQPYLLQHEAENNLPLGVLASVISGEYIEKTPYMELVEEEGVPILVMMCTPPFPVLFTYREAAPSHQVLTHVLVDLQDELGEDFIDLLNSTTNHIYQQIGYKSVCDVDRYDFR